MFNPVEKALLADIKDKMSQNNMPYSFKDLENRRETRMSISRLLVNPRLLLEENISCFDHPAPAFNEKKYLEQASNSKHLNIGDVRNSFPSDFLDGLKRIVETDSQDLTFELSKTVEMKDLSEEIRKAMDETEMELEDA